MQNLISGVGMTNRARHTSHHKREWGKAPTQRSGQIGKPSGPLWMSFLH